MFQTKMGTPLIRGSVAPGFEAVERAFTKSFRERGELGAACAVYHQGNKVVDLWGGYREAKRRAPWEEDTLVLVFSATKGMAAMTMALAHSQWLFAYNEPVATYWPEFAQAGKEHITVRQLLSHLAGLCCIDEPLNASILADLDAVAALLARQKPVAEFPTSRLASIKGFHAREMVWAYAPNKMGFYPWNDPREKALKEALDRCLTKRCLASHESQESQRQQGEGSDKEGAHR